MPRVLNNLQVLRGAAALAVAYFHLFCPAFNVGSTGVDVFFVISGFIMSQVCDTRPEHFLAKRIVRIVPLYWTWTLGLFLVAAVFPQALKSVTPDPTRLVQSLLFIPYRRENGLINPMIPPGWTLNYEMYFYALVAASLLVVRPGMATAAASAALAAVAALLRAGGWTHPAAVFYSDPIVGEFCLGVAAFWLWKRLPPSRVPGPGALLVLLILSGAGLLASEYGHLDRQVPGGRLLAFGLPAFLVVTSALFLESSRRVERRVLILAGDASYSIYLSHMFVIEFVGRFVARRVPALDPAGLAGAAVALGLALAVGIGSYLLFEAPVTAWLKHRVLREARGRPAPSVP